MNCLSSLLLPVLLALFLPVTAADSWKPLTPPIAATFVTADKEGTVYVIDTASKVYFLQQDSTAWKPLLKSKKIKYLSVSPEGTITALDKTAPYGYVRSPGGKWESQNMNLQALLYTNGGSRCMLTTDGRVLFDGSMLTGAFIGICPMQKANGIYLISSNNTLMIYNKGDVSPQTVNGKVGVLMMAGSGYGINGGHFILDNSPEKKLYRYDPANAGSWHNLYTPVTFMFIAMGPSGILYGIGTDLKIYQYGNGL